VEWIEPLAGILRHPRFLCDGSIKAQNVDHLLLADSSKVHAEDGPASAQRMILLDAGAGAFASSLGWFLAAYEARGITFDRIYAWEIATDVVPTFWEHVPAKYISRLTLFNAPVRANRSSFSIL